MIDGPAGRLWVEIHGRGDPVTVFAHGVTGSTYDLEPLASRTAGTRVLFDLRGHGRSDAPEEEAGYDHAAFASDLLCVAEAYGATRAFGLSAGSGAILHIAARAPERFERLVLMLPASFEAAPTGLAAAYGPLADQLARMPVRDVAIAASSADEPLLRARPYWRDIVFERTLRMRPEGVSRALRGYTAGDPPVADPASLAAVRAPTLVIAHRGDPLHDVAVAEQIAGALPDATLLVWDEPLAMYDDVDELAAVIGDALR